jgi:hypothetical protein
MTTSASLIQLFASLLIGLTVVYMTLSILQKRLMKKNDISFDNTSFAIFSAAILFCVGYLISGATQPFLSTIKVIQQSEGTNYLLECFKYAGLFLFISGLLSLALVLCSTFIFKVVSNGIKGIEELKNNNIAVAIISASIIIALALIVRENAIALMESFIPYPTSPVVY